MSQSHLPSSFRKLYMDNQQRLIAYARRFVGDDALDIVHDSFVKFYEFYTISNTEQDKKILFTIVRNNCLDYLRHKVVEAGEGVINANSPEGEELLYNFDYFYSTADNGVLYAELATQINAIMDTLPQRCKEVFLLKRKDGLKNREIAQKLGISQKTVEKHIHKALTAFQLAINEDSSPILKMMVLLWLASMNS